jgi:hypothetical protein
MNIEFHDNLIHEKGEIVISNDYVKIPACVHNNTRPDTHESKEQSKKDE